MSGLLKAANVVQGDGPWSRGYAVESTGCALRSATIDVCSPSSAREDLSGPSDVEVGDCVDVEANVFAVEVLLRGRAMRMRDGGYGPLVSGALDMETEKAAGKALWGLIGDNPETSLMNPSVGSVVAGADANNTVAAALTEFWSKTVGIAYEDTIIHLGVGRLMELFGEIEGSLLKNLDIKIATSPGYPAEGIAVTGPITVKLGSDQVLESTDSSDNTAHGVANRLVAIEFDPCNAVRVA